MACACTSIYLYTIKESMYVCNANKLLLFGGVFTTPVNTVQRTAYVMPLTVPSAAHARRISLPHMLNVHRTLFWWLYTSGAWVCRYGAFSTTIVRASPDWATLVYIVSPQWYSSRLRLGCLVKPIHASCSMIKLTMQIKLVRSM